MNSDNFLENIEKRMDKKFKGWGEFIEFMLNTRKELEAAQTDLINYHSLRKAADAVCRAWNTEAPDVILGDRINEMQDLLS